jgi:hypothetical protein
LTKAFSTNATRYSTISLLFLLSVYLGPQAWALPRTGDAWSRKWTQALMLATSAHCAISSGHPSMRAFQMRRALSKCIAAPDLRSAQRLLEFWR